MSTNMNNIFNFGRNLPEPFDTMASKKVKVTSKYGSGTEATINCTMIKAVHAVCQCMSGTGEGAVGLIDHRSVAEYKSSMEESAYHLAVYDHSKGMALASVYNKDTETMETYTMNPKGRDGAAVIMAMMPFLMEDEEFAEQYERYYEQYQKGYPDFDAAKESMAILCDNAYRRIKDETCSAHLKLDVDASGNLMRVSNAQIDSGAFTPVSVTAGEFTIFAKTGPATIKKAGILVEKKDFEGKYVMQKRTLNAVEESLVPKIPDWYIIPQEEVEICRHAKETTGKSMQMRNFLLRGPAGTGKTMGAKAIAAGLNLPYMKYTCSAGTEIFDFVGMIFPDSDSGSTGDESESEGADGTRENESEDENDDASGKTSGESESDDDSVIPSQKMGNSRKQKTTENEQGRIPLAQTSSVSNPVGGTVSRDEDYERECDERAAADIERMLDKMAERSACEQLENERLQELNETAQNISYGNIHEGVEIRVKRISSVDEELVEQYDQVAGSLLAISKQMQKSLVKQLKESRRGGKMTGLLMGRRLDTHALCRNDGKVFYKNSLPNEIPEMAVGLLLDESGSMSSCDRCTYARATAIILYDFCRGLDIPVMIYGHSTGYDSSHRDTVDLYSYAEFESIDQDDQYRMMDISARGGNRDGAALRFVAEQLSKRPEEIKILMIVSDGQPADTGYGGTAAEEDLRGIRQEYQRKNVIFVAAAIGDDKQNIERIYGDSFMDITDLNQLPTKLTGVVRRHIRV